jgi:hypothetical protein
MIGSRWKVIDGGDAVARLKSARFVVTNLDLDFNVFHFDDELRRRLNKFREEGMDFSIIDSNKNDLLGTRDYLSILLLVKLNYVHRLISYLLQSILSNTAV